MSELLPGLCSVTFRALPPDAVIALAAECGLSGIEWGADIHVPPHDRALARSIAAHCRDADIAIASYGSYVEAGNHITGQNFADVLEAAQALGAPNIRVWGGQRGLASAEASLEMRNVAAHALHDMAAKAATLGIALSLEFHPQTLNDGAKAALALLAAARHSNLHTYWQPRPGIAADEAEAELAALAPHLSHLHVFYWKASGERLPLADGADFWRPLLRRVRAMPSPHSRPRYALLEFVSGDDPDALRRDAHTLRNWLDETATLE
ncbi:TIM barrel protein [Parvibaculum sedimenti]|uniref:TIM barrel protein n=1 Tax=Parvibaculum sedimenti TaxID=2608632 RepID=A0A6N6VJB0_9HYPH|nr:TIM barrel protein [Parvibaculum sedimenti]KAB7741498.1 TIM barrel protein [Parvibaculum sedimenti]